MQASVFREEVLQKLTALHVSYTLHQHPAVHSMDDCLSLPFVTSDMVFAKNLLLETPTRDRRILLMLPPWKPFKTSVVSKLLHVSRLSFASPEVMTQTMFTRPGALSPLGLLAEPARGTMLAIDCQIMTYNQIAMHPCDATETVTMPMLDFLSILVPALECPYVALNIPEAP